MRGNISKSKTLKGEDGPPGYTPKKGVDYLTDAEIQAFKDENLTPISESLDKHKSNGDKNAQHLTDAEKSDVGKIGGIESDVNMLTQYEIPNVWIAISDNADRLNELTAPPITNANATIEANKEYDFGFIDGLALSLPTQANDGDVIYIGFVCLVEMNFVVDMTNICEFDLIPEINTGYEIYAKYNSYLRKWIVKYSEYSGVGE